MKDPKWPKDLTAFQIYKVAFQWFFIFQGFCYYGIYKDLQKMLEMLLYAMQMHFYHFMCCKNYVKQKIAWTLNCSNVQKGGKLRSYWLLGSKRMMQNYFLISLSDDFPHFIRTYLFKGIYVFAWVGTFKNQHPWSMAGVVGWLVAPTGVQPITLYRSTPGVKGCILYMCQKTWRTVSLSQPPPPPTPRGLISS